MAVAPIPEEYPRLTPYLAVSDAVAAIDFYREVLGATERMRMAGLDGRIGHCELDLGNSMIMLADEHPEMDFRSPRLVGGTPVTLHCYVADVDATFAAALAHGATEVRAVEDRFYGDRSGMFEDPFGHRWNVASHTEEVGPEEMNRRLAEEMNQTQA